MPAKPRMFSILSQIIHLGPCLKSTADVVVNGAKSDLLTMQNMVYQGTVLGPILWNLFFKDAGMVVQNSGFKDITYADDLNAFREHPCHVSNYSIWRDMKKVQKQLHMWGEANGVRFDAGKESFHVLSKTGGYGGNFKLLGINFDPKLLMHDAIHDCVVACNWKLQSILRSKKFYCDVDVLITFKAHILNYIEYRTAAISHAAPSCLDALDDILTRLLVRLGISHEEALFAFNLAPLNARRDIAQLGMIYRAVLRMGPAQLHQFFIRVRPFHGHAYTIYDPCVGRPQQFFKRSIFGLIHCYNRLSDDIIDLKNVSHFQSNLQQLLKTTVSDNNPHWKNIFRHS